MSRLRDDRPSSSRGETQVDADLLDAGWHLASHALNADGVWIANRSSGGQVSYPDQFRDQLASLETRSLWFQSRNQIIEAVIGRRTDSPNLIEVGAGNGAVAAHLSSRGMDVMAIEPSLDGARHAANRGVRISVAGSLEDLALPTASVRAVGLFDVLEHLESEQLLLSEVHRVLRPGGWCVVTVPALRSLWSQADDHAGHHRRYDRRSLDAALSRVGLERTFSSYCFTTAVVPLVLLRTWPYRRGRRLSDTQMARSLERELAGQGRILTSVGLQLSRLEAWWLRQHSLPFGTSLIAIFRKAGVHSMVTPEVSNTLSRSLTPRRSNTEVEG